jgi:hypothetical protein
MDPCEFGVIEPQGTRFDFMSDAVFPVRGCGSSGQQSP